MGDGDVNVKVFHLGKQPLTYLALVLLDFHVDGLDMFVEHGLLPESFLALTAGVLLVQLGHMFVEVLLILKT